MANSSIISGLMTTVGSIFVAVGGIVGASLPGEWRWRVAIPATLLIVVGSVLAGTALVAGHERRPKLRKPPEPKPPTTAHLPRPVATDAPTGKTNTTSSRPDYGTGTKYLQSYLLIRTVIGFILIFLPNMLLTADWLLLQEAIERSLSAYYYSALRDVLVGSLCAAGVLLIMYLFFETNIENSLSTIAGIALIGAAVLPTSRPVGTNWPLGHLQESIGERSISTIHYTCLSIAVLSLASICYFFGIHEGLRMPRQGRWPPNYWRRFHFACATVAIAAVGFMAAANFGGWLEDSRMLGEIVASLACGLSWLMKGLDLDILREPSGTGDL